MAKKTTKTKKPPFGPGDVVRCNGREGEFLLITGPSSHKNYATYNPHFCGALPEDELTWVRTQVLGEIEQKLVALYERGWKR